MHQGWTCKWWGTICNLTVHFIWAFSSSHGECSTLDVKLQAILDGILLARHFGVLDMWMEADSFSIVHCFTNGWGPFSNQDTSKYLRNHLSFNSVILYTYRERNILLTYFHQKNGSSAITRSCTLVLPQWLHVLVKINKHSLPSFRGLHVLVLFYHYTRGIPSSFTAFFTWIAFWSLVYAPISCILMTSIFNDKEILTFIIVIW